MGVPKFCERKGITRWSFSGALRVQSSKLWARNSGGCSARMRAGCSHRALRFWSRRCARRWGRPPDLCKQTPRCHRRCFRTSNAECASGALGSSIVRCCAQPRCCFLAGTYLWRSTPLANSGPQTRHFAAACFVLHGHGATRCRRPCATGQVCVGGATLMSTHRAACTSFQSARLQAVWIDGPVARARRSTARGLRCCWCSVECPNPRERLVLARAAWRLPMRFGADLAGNVCCDATNMRVQKNAHGCRPSRYQKGASWLRGFVLAYAVKKGAQRFGAWPFVVSAL